MHRRSGGSYTECSAVRVLRTLDELRDPPHNASRFDDHARDPTRTRTEGIHTSAPKITSLSTLASPSVAEPPRRIEIFADLSCPFAHVSLRTVKGLRDEIAPAVPILVRAWPLELINGAPLDPAVTARHVAELRRDIAPELFVGFRAAAMPRSTLRCLALVEVANDVDPWLGERISLDLREILFEQGRSIDDAMLSLLVAESELDPSACEDTRRVEERLAEGRRRGVEGSPHVFVGEVGVFCPLLDMDTDEAGALHLHERRERLRLLIQGLESPGIWPR